MSRVDRNQPGSTSPALPDLLVCEEPDAAGLNQTPPNQTPVDGTDDGPVFLYAPVAPPQSRERAPEAHLLLELDSRLAYSRTGTVAPKPTTGSTPPPATGTEIDRNRDEIKVTTTSKTITAHEPWEMNEVIPENRKGKASNYRELLAAEDRLETAVANEQKAQTNLGRARAKHAEAPTAKTAAAVTSAEKKLAEATQAREKAEVAYKKEDSELRAALKGKKNEKPDEVDALDFQPTTVEREKFVVETDKGSATFTNAVDSYATARREGLTGKATGDSKQVVKDAIDGTDYSDSTKRVFKGVSSNEGTFSSINGYDSKGLTFGFIQMAGGGAGETLSDFFATLKKQHPEAFAELQKLGIDVEKTKDGHNQLILRQPDGTVLRGKAAAIEIGSNSKLAGALAIAGTDPDVQDSQMRFAKAYWDRQRGNEVSAKGQTIKVSDLITSEYGNGVLFDRSVHGGVEGARKVLEGVVAKYLEEHPKADLSDEKVRAEIETRYTALIASNKDFTGRCANIAKETSKERGSYVD